MSDNELIGFKERANYDFLKFRYAQAYEQEELNREAGV